ncbi:MAG: hypothetical protein ACJA0U_003410 [Salibacteraceae bacterium]|jgi:hypothetical protein
MKKIVLFAVLALVFVSCSKYEEESASLLSKKSRVANTWKVKSATAYGVDYTSSYPVKEIEITKEGGFTESIVENGITGFYDGTWEFNDDKTQLLVTFSNANRVYTILKLEKDAMKISPVPPDSEFITELVTK